MTTFTTAQIAKLRSQAQRLDASLKIGKNGLSEPFLQTVRAELGRRELIKIKFDEFKDQKKTLAPELAAKCDSVLVTLIGNMVVLYKENADPEKRKITV